mgnify:CR=1 FL=1
MLTPEQIKMKLRPMNISVVARDTRLGRNTLHRFITGQEKRTAYHTIKVLSDYLENL